MTHPESALAPIEVRDFVVRVRDHLADLDPEEQQELTVGLEADLTDLVAERGADELGDPAAYARELRVAAGHNAEMNSPPAGRGVRQAVMDAIDSTHASWDRLLASLPGDLRGFLSAIQPVWWVLRAWVAWMVAQDLRGPYVVLDDAKWLVLLVTFAVVSVQLGRREWGFGRLLAASVLARLLLVALNIFAVTMTIGAADRMAWHVAERRAWQYVAEDAGLPHADPVPDKRGKACVLEVRDAQGRVIRHASVWDRTDDRRLPRRIDGC